VADILEMSQAEYARHRGVTKQAIGKLVAAEKIPITVKPNGKKVIDVAAADRALGETRERVSVRDDPPDDAPPRAPAEGAGLTRAKTATEVYRARLAQLEYEERVGNLLPVAQVQDAATACAEAMLRVLEIPLSRVDALLAAGAKGITELRQVVRELIRDQRSRCVAEFNKLAAAAAVKSDTDTPA
jgi:hypothetical protein